jgi:Domain of unknown function (DUF4157)
MAVSPEIESSIQQARGSGQPLAESIRNPMEQAFGTDFSGVRVHTDERSDRLNRSVQAKAFTTKQDIFFRDNFYKPNSQEGQKLIAHELTHIVQQNGDVVQRSQAQRTFTIKSFDPETLQRQIYYMSPPHQFQINNTRPNWIGAVANFNPVNGQSRNHIVAFEVIQNDLCNKLNNITNPPLPPNNIQYINELINLTDSLFPNNVAERLTMQNCRTQLLTSIQNGVNGSYTQEAQSLLRILNSSSDNVRVGDSAINGSIGYSIDAEFQAGTIVFNGNVRTSNGVVNVINLTCLILTPHSERIVYRYQVESGLPMSFVVNGLNGVLNPAAQPGQQLSSTQLPTVAPVGNPIQPYPVLVRDPNGVNLPFLYQ